MPRHYQIKTASRRYRKWLVDDLPVVVNGRVRGPYDVASITPKAVGSGRFRIGGNRAGVYGMTLDGTAVAVGNKSNSVSFSVFNTPSLDVTPNSA
jgi:hypothetical protein